MISAKEARRKAREEKDRANKIAGLAECKELIEKLSDKGRTYLSSMKVSELKILIRYHFRSSEGSKAGLLKTDVVAIATALYDASMIDV